MVAETTDDSVRVILASSSPRRRALLAMAGFAFDLVPPSVEEVMIVGESPNDFVMRMARAKARNVVAVYAADADVVVLAADTVVVVDGDVLGKPADTSEAAGMLERIGGREHTVLTGYALFIPPDTELAAGVARSSVEMVPVTRQEALRYAASGEPLDKAGGYALQGDGARFVRRVDGPRSNVVGLPLGEIVPLLEAAGATRTRL